MSDIFISFEKSDLHRAELLARSFKAHGWTTFWDRTIPAGSTWRKTIGKELDDARCVVVLWSKASSQSTWVHDEADDARERGILVPVLIENIRPPIGFRSIQAANLASWDGTDSAEMFGKLVADIAGIIGPGRNQKADDRSQATGNFSRGKTIRPLDDRDSQRLHNGAPRAEDAAVALHAPGQSGRAADKAVLPLWLEDELKRQRKIFINCRLADGPTMNRICEQLAVELPNAYFRMFQAGDFWRDEHTRERIVGEKKLEAENELETEIGSCRVCLVLIGPSWMEFDAEGEYVRFTIGIALQHSVPVTLVVLPGGKMPTLRQLPPRLKELAKQIPNVIDEHSFDQDVRQLVPDLKLKLFG